MAVFQAVFVVLFVVYGAKADTCCADSWVPFQGSCYYFYDEVKVNWAGAISHCKLHDANLAMVESDNENRFLKHYARKMIRKESEIRNNTMFWLGASDSDIDGIWKWVTTDQALVFVDWDPATNPGQPNNKPDNHEDCLALNGGYDFGWHDGICSYNLGSPLCEKQGSQGSGIDNMQLIG